MIVIIDTNIWIKEYGLRSNLGTVARFHLKRSGCKLGLPEPVELEVLRHLQTTVEESVQALRKAFRTLTILAPPVKELILPTDDQLADRINAFFDAVDVEIERIPFSLDSAKDSFLMKINKVPPSKTSQQFKDGVIWADCVKLLEKCDVTLVTSDKAFYEASDPKNGLAINLAEEIAVCNFKFHIFDRLENIIEKYHNNLQIDKLQIAKNYISLRKSELDSFAEKFGFSLRSIESISFDFFVTENIDVLYSKFDISIRIEQESEAGAPLRQGRLMVKGEGEFDLATKSFISTNPLGERLEYISSDGEKIQHTQDYGWGHATFGPRDVIHKTRQHIDL